MLMVVPGFDPEPWPSLGAELCDFIEDRGIYGPGSLEGQPYVIDPEFRAQIYRLYEVYPQGHEWAGRRRFKRGGISIRKGLAKCLAPETPVLMADGTERQASDILIGDAVVSYTDDRRMISSTVAHVEVQPPSSMWTITTERGRSLTVTSEHPMLVRGTRMLPGVPNRRRYASCDPDRDREQWVPASDLIVGDRLVVALGWQGLTAMPTLDAWILGAMIGDASPDGRFTSEDPEILDRLRERFEVTHCGRYDYYLKGSRPFMREHGILGCNSRTKRVPASIMTADPETVVAFLAGYLDTDGWASFTPRPSGKTHTEIAWGSVNRGLLAECQTLLASLGYNATLCPSYGTYKGERHLSWNLAVRDTVQAAALASDLLSESVHLRKRAKLALIANRSAGRVFAQRDTDKVVSIEPAGIAESIAIEVADTHTHVTSGLVTHNTEKQALIVLAELHPEAPVRCDGFDAEGRPVGRPVRHPYIPMLAYSVDQVEELAYGALRYIVENGPDADLFDIGLERIIRLDEKGRDGGKALPLAQSPNSRDGARTTLNAYDEPHRLYLERFKQAHATMEANLAKRPLEDPWSLYVGTAGEPGQGSVAEELHDEAEKIHRGEMRNPRLCYFYRTDDKPKRDLTIYDERIEAIKEATGPAGEWGPGQFADIAEQWDRPGANLAYLERVWLNRWKQSSSQAFDALRWDNQLCHIGGDENGDLRPVIPRKAKVAAGFDGARLRDSTALVITDLETGTQELLGLWEQDLDDPEWEVPEDEVSDAVAEMFGRYNVWKLYADPPYWTTEVGRWAGLHAGKVEEWWMNRYKASAYSLQAYQEAQRSGAVGWSPGHRHAAAFSRHIGNSGLKELKGVLDDQGRPMHILAKIHPDRKLDAAAAGQLSWQGYLDAHKKGQAKRRRPARIRRIR